VRWSIDTGKGGPLLSTRPGGQEFTPGGLLRGERASAAVVGPPPARLEIYSHPRSRTSTYRRVRFGDIESALSPLTVVLCSLGGYPHAALRSLARSLSSPSLTLVRLSPFPGPNHSFSRFCVPARPLLPERALASLLKRCNAAIKSPAAPSRASLRRGKLKLLITNKIIRIVNSVLGTIRKDITCCDYATTPRQSHIWKERHVYIYIYIYIYICIICHLGDEWFQETRAARLTFRSSAFLLRNDANSSRDRFSRR